MEYYHNPRCRKSREGLEFLKSKGLEPNVIEYMNEPLKPQELSLILEKMDAEADQLIRKNESIWKDEFKDKELSNDELVLAMIEHPKLMERPILVNGDKARVGRPAEKFLEIL